MRKLFVLLLFSFFTLQGMAQTPLDKKLVIQKCIDLDEMQAYYHEDSDDRKPLIIFDNDVIPDKLKLSKFNEPVVFMTQQDLFTLGKTAYLQFTKFSISEDKAEVVFRYDVEGITVKVLLEKVGGDWLVESETISEK